MAGQVRKAIETEERQVLLWFFTYVATDIHLASRGKFLPGAESHPLYQTALETLRNRLQSGWTLTGIRDALVTFKDSGNKSVELHEVLTENPEALEEQDLLQSKQSYYHTALRKLDPPLFILTLEGTMEIVDTGSMSLVPKFTLQDLKDYYMRRLSPCSVPDRTLQQVLHWMLTHGDSLDEILFAIDFYAVQGEDEFPGENPWRLRDYITQARKELAWRRGSYVPHIA